MNDLDFEQTARNNHLDDAIASLDQHGRYWSNAIPRPTAKALFRLLENLGYEIIYREIAPNWEHVFYKKEFHGEIEQIATQRAELAKSDYPDKDLPV